MECVHESHVRSAVRTDKIMELVLLALLPASIFGVWHFGWNALLLIIVSVGTCVLTEYVYEKLMHKKITVSDCSCSSDRPSAGLKSCLLQRPGGWLFLAVFLQSLL